MATDKCHEAGGAGVSKNSRDDVCGDQNVDSVSGGSSPPSADQNDKRGPSGEKSLVILGLPFIMRRDVAP